MPGTWRITPRRVSQQYFLLLAHCHSVKHTSETCQKSAGSRERLRKSAGKSTCGWTRAALCPFQPTRAARFFFSFFSFHQHVFSVLMLTKKTSLLLSLLLQPSWPTVPYVLLSHLSNESGTGFPSRCRAPRLWTRRRLDALQRIHVSVHRNPPLSSPPPAGDVFHIWLPEAAARLRRFLPAWISVHTHSRRCGEV